MSVVSGSLACNRDLHGTRHRRHCVAPKTCLLFRTRFCPGPAWSRVNHALHARRTTTFYWYLLTLTYLVCTQGLREEISSLQHRVEELETGNCALSALLVQRLSNQRISYSPTATVAMPVVESRSVMFDVHRSPPPSSMVSKRRPFYGFGECQTAVIRSSRLDLRLAPSNGPYFT